MATDCCAQHTCLSTCFAWRQRPNQSRIWRRRHRAANSMRTSTLRTFITSHPGSDSTKLRDRTVSQFQHDHLAAAGHTHRLASDVNGRLRPVWVKPGPRHREDFTPRRGRPRRTTPSLLAVAKFSFRAASRRNTNSRGNEVLLELFELPFLGEEIQTTNGSIVQRVIQDIANELSINFQDADRRASR